MRHLEYEVALKGFHTTVDLNGCSHGLCGAGIAFISFFVPETSGRTQDQISALLCRDDAVDAVLDVHRGRRQVVAAEITTTKPRWLGSDASRAETAEGQRRRLVSEYSSSVYIS